MTFDYSRSKATASRLISRFGQSATLTQETLTGPDYNPTITETDYTVKVAVMEYSNLEVDGSSIQQTDRMAYLSTDGLSVTPQTDDKLTIGGQEHQIINVKPLSPGGTVVFYELQVRI